MTPLNILGPDILIVVLVLALLFGGSRLAGLGKGAGRAIREFHEETHALNEKPDGPEPAPKA